MNEEFQDLTNAAPTLSFDVPTPEPEPASTATAAAAQSPVQQTQS